MPCLACRSTGTHLLQAKRKGSLKLIIMSATLDASAFAGAFPGAQIVYVQVAALRRSLWCVSCRLSLLCSQLQSCYCVPTACCLPCLHCQAECTHGQ